jgi:hypothetical protein
MFQQIAGKFLPISAFVRPILSGNLYARKKIKGELSSPLIIFNY